MHTSAYVNCIRQWGRYNKHVHTPVGAGNSCCLSWFNRAWSFERYCFPHTLHNVYFSSAVFPIANRSWLSQTRGLRAKTIQAVHTHNTVSCDRTTISTWHLENRKNVSAGTTDVLVCLEEECEREYKTPVDRNFSLTPLRQRDCLHHVILWGKGVGEVYSSVGAWMCV